MNDPNPYTRRDPDRGGPAFREDRVVFNIVWTGGVFSLLEPLTVSILRHSEAKVRFIANACPQEEVTAMERFGGEHPDRMADIVVVSEEFMVRHGSALDRVLATSDDGPYFSLLDPDIFVVGPFLTDVGRLLSGASAVTAGKEVWSDDNVRPSEHPGVSGEFFFDQDGFVFGSPHFAIYESAGLRETMQRWDVGFGSTGNDLSERTRQRLEEMKRSFWVYDTAKLVNILMQGDGHGVVHEELENLVHIGGVSHFLAPPATAPGARDKPPKWGEGSDWCDDPKNANRAAVARYTADLLTALRARESPPPLPEDAGHLAERLESVRRSLIALHHRR